MSTDTVLQPGTQLHAQAQAAMKEAAADPNAQIVIILRPKDADAEGEITLFVDRTDCNESIGQVVARRLGITDCSKFTLLWGIKIAEDEYAAFDVD